MILYSSYSKLKLKTSFEYVTGFLILMMCVFNDGRFMIIKSICLIYLLYFSIWHPKPISKIIGYLIGIYVFIGCYGIFSGIINDTKEPFQVATSVIIWPLLGLPILSQFDKTEYYHKLLRLLFLIHCIILFYDLWVVFSVIFNLPLIEIYKLDIPYFSYYPEHNTSRLNLVNLNVLNYTFPIIFLCWLIGYNLRINKIVLLFVIFCTFFLLIISGRRSVMLLSLLIIPISMFLSFNLKKEYSNKINSKLKILSSIIIVVLILLFSFSPEIIEGYWNTFTKAFDAGEEPIKFAQKEMFYKEIEKNPIFGNGVGKEFYEPFPGRSIFATKFELQYFLITAQTGFFGLIFYLCFYLGIFFIGLIKSIKYQDAIGIIIFIGFFFILISNATNPVMTGFNQLVPLFISLSYLNFITLQKTFR